MISWLIGTAFALPLADAPLVLEATMVTRAKVPVVGWIEVTSTSVAAVDFTPAPQGWQVTQRLCSVELSNRPNVGQTVIPDAFIAAYPEQTYLAHVEVTDGVMRFMADPGASWVGAEPNPAGTLPNGPDWLGESDFEEDGKPGATVLVKVPFVGRIEMYVAQVGHHRFEGTVEEGRIEGSIEMVRMEQRTLGSSHPRLAGDVEREWLGERSRFIVRPRGPGDCGE